jgi:3-phenylpropionate/trans-cinnamate dioxygenase ferredoxin reductase component
MVEPLIIVGAGQTAAQAIASLRADGFDRPIMLFGDEPFLPYQRPPLSKAFLAGEASPERLEVRPAAFYSERDVDLKLGCRVTRLLPRDHAIEDASGRLWAYSKLLIATGTRPRPLPLPGDDLAGIHHIRAIRDVERFREEFSHSARLVIVGGGYIGLEVAAKARKLGLDVTILETQPRILARVVAEETSAFLAGLHADHGVHIRTGVEIRAFVGAGRVEGVRLASGETIPADIVLVAIGALPNHELATAAGLATQNGIVVDAGARTDAPDIYAAGDVACFPSRLYGRHLRLESVQNAIDHAKAAAATILGAESGYDPVPWFWSDQYEIKLQIAGLSHDADRIVIEGEPISRRFSVRYFRGDRLIAVDSLNDARSHMLARRQLASEAPENAAA